MELSKKQVRKAGQVLSTCVWDSSGWVNDPTAKQALEILYTWRNENASILPAFNSFIRRRIKQAKINDAIVAQRLKRLPSIIGKLQRFQNMTLDRMQDIAGIRVIVPNITVLNYLFDFIKNNTGERELENIKNYIEVPKEDGYRSIHMIFKVTNGLRIELQLRTQLQHSWATAVESLGMITGNSIKTGHGGDEFRTFLKTASAIFAIAEGCPPPNEYSNFSQKDLIQKLISEDQQVKAIQKLQVVTFLVNKIDSKTKAAHYLIEMDTNKKTVSINPFVATQTTTAEMMYRMREQETHNQSNIHIVLVSVDNMKELRNAYPSFFMDTKLFIDKIRQYSQI